VDKKLKPFLTKKIVEYVGDAEQSLVDFVMEKIKNKSDAPAIVEELKPVS
jgi:PWI domain